MSRQSGEDGYEEEEDLNTGVNANVVGPTVEQLLAQLTAERERNTREQ